MTNARRAVAAVAALAAIALSGCSAGAGLALGGSGVSGCVPNPEALPYVMRVPLQNDSDAAVTIDEAHGIAMSGADAVAYVLPDSESSGTLASGSFGLASDVAGLDAAAEAAGYSVAANTRVDLVIVVTPSGTDSAVQGVQVSAGGSTLTSTVEVSASGMCG